LAREQATDSDCDWLKQLKRFMVGPFCSMAEIKQFQNSAETVLFHFNFNCADIQFEAFRRTAQFLSISFPFPLSCSWEADPLKSSYTESGRASAKIDFVHFAPKFDIR